MPRTDLSQRAEGLLARAREADADPQEAEALRMEAVTVAILAVAKELNDPARLGRPGEQRPGWARRIRYGDQLALHRGMA